MKHKLLFQVLIIVNVSVGGAVVAQSSNSPFAIARDCVRALENGEMERVQLFVENILSWEDAAPSVVRRAEQCVAATHADQFDFQPGLGWVTQQEATAYQTEAATLRAEAIMRRMLNRIRPRYSDLNNDLVEASVIQGCRDLAESDPASAFTNEICISSFRHHGHPELPEFEDFVGVDARELFEQLTDGESGLIEGLDAGQLQALCTGEFDALCASLGLD